MTGAGEGPDSGAGGALDDLLVRAAALLELGRPVEAERLARDALALDPLAGPALVVLTEALSAQRRHAEAVDAGRDAVAADPQASAAHVALAWALERDGRAAEAVEVARAAVALDPHDWTTHHALGWSLLRTSPPRAREAGQAAARALELEPGATPAHSVLGLALAASGRRRAGRRVLREGLRIAPDDPYLHNNLAKLDLDRGLRVGRTARHLRAAAAGIPQEQAVHRNLDTLLLRFGVRLAWPTLLALGVLRLQLALGAPWWSRALTGAVFLGVVGLLVGWFARRAPRGLRRWGAGVLRRVSLPLRLLSWALIGFGMLVVATAVAPDGWAAPAERAAGLALRATAVLAVALAVGEVVRRRRPGGGSS